jgi:hypothetical protein
MCKEMTEYGWEEVRLDVDKTMLMVEKMVDEWITSERGE